MKKKSSNNLNPKGKLFLNISLNNFYINLNEFLNPKLIINSDALYFFDTFK